MKTLFTSITALFLVLTLAIPANAEEVPEPSPTQEPTQEPTPEPTEILPQETIFRSSSFHGHSEYVYGSNFGLNVNVLLAGTDTRTVILQRLNPKTATWDNYETDKTEYGQRVYFYIKPNGITTDWRFYVPPVKGFTEVYSPVKTITRTISNSQIARSQLPQSKIVPWKTNIIEFAINSPITTGTVKIQRTTGRTWKTIATIKIDEETDNTIKYSIPKGTKKAKNATYKYRAYLEMEGFKPSYSGTSTVKIINPYRYTGTAKKVWNYIKSYCPTTMVEMDKGLGKKKLWGQAYMGTDIVKMYTKIPSNQLKQVSLHECAHMRQWKLYSDDWTGFKKTMNKVYKAKNTKGMEQNADCIAYAWGSKTPLYYVNSTVCRGEEARAGKLLSQNKLYYAPKK